MRKILLVVFIFIFAICLVGCTNNKQNIGSKMNNVNRTPAKINIEKLNTTISKNPKIPEPYFLRGMENLKRKNYNEAINDFDNAIILNPKEKKYYRSRGNAKMGIKDYKGAYEDYNSVLKLDPSDTFAASQKRLIEKISKR